MSKDMPEVIWAWEAPELDDYETAWSLHQPHPSYDCKKAKYIRADIHEEQVRILERRIENQRVEIKNLLNTTEVVSRSAGGFYKLGRERMKQAKELEEQVRVLREALMWSKPYVARLRDTWIIEQALEQTKGSE